MRNELKMSFVGRQTHNSSPSFLDNNVKACYWKQRRNQTWMMKSLMAKWFEQASQ